MTPIMRNEAVCQVSTLLILLEGCLLKASPVALDANTTHFMIYIERIFLFSLSWSIGGLLPEIDRHGFDRELRVMSLVSMPPKVGF